MRPTHWLFTVPSRLRSLLRRRQVERELDDELRFHLEHQIDVYIDRGLAPDEARFGALRAFAGVEQRKEECRDMRHMRAFDELVQDASYARRTLARSPGFTFIVVLTLALGIGANTAIFTLMDQVLLRALPVQNPEEPVALDAPGPQRGRIEGEHALSYPMYSDIRDRNTVLDGVLISSAISIRSADVSASAVTTPRTSKSSAWPETETTSGCATRLRGWSTSRSVRTPTSDN